MILPIKHNANKISKQLFDEQDDTSLITYVLMALMMIKYVTVHLMETVKKKKNKVQKWS